MSARADAARVAHGEEIGWLGRAGLAAKGVSYGLVAVLALLVALGEGHGKTTDRHGALETVGGHPLAKRAGAFARGVLYGALCAVTVAIILGANGDSGNEREVAARILDHWVGRWLVGAVGLGVLAAGVYNAWRAASCGFMDDLKTIEMSERERTLYRVIGAVGHAARAVVFCLVGWFLLKTAWQHDPQEAVGVDGALRKLALGDNGHVWLGTVAAGLGAYGVFCLVQARYRRV